MFVTVITSSSIIPPFCQFMDYRDTRVYILNLASINIGILASCRRNKEEKKLVTIRYHIWGALYGFFLYEQSIFFLFSFSFSYKAIAIHREKESIDKLKCLKKLLFNQNNSTSIWDIKTLNHFRFVKEWNISIRNPSNFSFGKCKMLCSNYRL